MAAFTENEYLMSYVLGASPLQQAKVYKKKTTTHVLHVYSKTFFPCKNHRQGANSPPPLPMSAAKAGKNNLNK
jgi:hypothetical protein